MTALVFIGDEVSSAGWRLTGMRVIVPESGDESRVVCAILEDPKIDLALLSSTCAHLLPAGLLNRFLTSIAPLTWVVPDVRGLQSAPDLGSQVRSRLGMNP